MAYSEVCKYNVKNSKNFQYYPQGYDQQSKLQQPERYSNKKYTNKRFKNNLNSNLSYSDKKCPIYVHQYNPQKINHEVNLSQKVIHDVYPNYHHQNKVLYHNELLKNKTKEPKPPKITLDKLEETYWASWKPKKDGEIKARATTRVTTRKESSKSRKPLNRSPIHNKSHNMAYGDVKKEMLVTYINANEMHFSDATICEESDYYEKEDSDLDIPTKEDENENLEEVLIDATDTTKDAQPKQQKTTPVSQEIQTSDHVFIVIKPVSSSVSHHETPLPVGRKLSPIMSAEENNVVINVSVPYSQPESQSASKTEVTIDEDCTVTLKNTQPNLIIDTPDITSGKEPSTETVILKEATAEQKECVFDKFEENKLLRHTDSLILTKKKQKTTKEESEDKPIRNEHETEYKSKLLKHTDSLIITKKKQEENENKEHYQQPKCIKLYRKSGVTLSRGYIKGGTYTLKSCLKKENASKGNFKLGAPGSNLFVSVNTSSNRRKRF